MKHKLYAKVNYYFMLNDNKIKHKVIFNFTPDETFFKLINRVNSKFQDLVKITNGKPLYYNIYIVIYENRIFTEQHEPEKSDNKNLIYFD